MPGQKDRDWARHDDDDPDLSDIPEPRQGQDNADAQAKESDDNDQ